MLYLKRAISVEEQISLLKERGVVFENEAFAQRVLNTVSYYRFSAYLYPFRCNDGTNNYTGGTSFEKC